MYARYIHSGRLRERATGEFIYDEDDVPRVLPSRINAYLHGNIFANFSYPREMTSRSRGVLPSARTSCSRASKGRIIEVAGNKLASYPVYSCDTLYHRMWKRHLCVHTPRPLYPFNLLRYRRNRYFGNIYFTDCARLFLLFMLEYGMRYAWCARWPTLILKTLVGAN